MEYLKHSIGRTISPLFHRATYDNHISTYNVPTRSVKTGLSIEYLSHGKVKTFSLNTSMVRVTAHQISDLLSTQPKVKYLYVSLRMRALKHNILTDEVVKVKLKLSIRSILEWQ